ncbi:4445_t:CDS:2, partial [Paraglomus brasilianum]
EKSIRTDLTKERPQWPYTVYAPAKEEPNLIEGTDVSPEELRFEFFKLKDFWMYGGEMQYNQGVSQLNSIMKQKIDDVLKDLRNSIRMYQNKIRPNSSNTFGGGRTQSRNTSQQPSNTFGSRSNGGFGQPQQSRAFGQQQSGFGRQQQGGFGSSGFSQQSNFGGFGQQQPLQPSPFGQQPGPGFAPNSNTLSPIQATQPNGGFGGGQTGFGSASNGQQQNPLGQSIQNPFGAQQQQSLLRGGMQGAGPDANVVGMSEYFTGQVPTSPPPNHY